MIIEMKTAELTGPALDWAVAKCKGTSANFLVANNYGGEHFYQYSTNWLSGGPIIEQESIAITPCEDIEMWAADMQFRQGVETQYGPTPLIAAMRCYCCAILGDEVDIPQELQPCQQPNL